MSLQHLRFFCRRSRVIDLQSLRPPPDPKPINLHETPDATPPKPQTVNPYALNSATLGLKP